MILAKVLNKIYKKDGIILEDLSVKNILLVIHQRSTDNFKIIKR